MAPFIRRDPRYQRLPSSEMQPAAKQSSSPARNRLNIVTCLSRTSGATLQCIKDSSSQKHLSLALCGDQVPSLITKVCYPPLFLVTLSLQGTSLLRHALEQTEFHTEREIARSSSMTISALRFPGGCKGGADPEQNPAIFYTSPNMCHSPS